MADAEVEYDDHTSTTVWVRFPVLQSNVNEVRDSAVVIWTTTPWTLPGNRAIAFGADMDYVVVQVTGVGENSLATVGERFVVAADLLDSVVKDAVVTDYGNRCACEGCRISRNRLPASLSWTGV